MTTVTKVEFLDDTGLLVGYRVLSESDRTVLTPGARTSTGALLGFWGLPDFNVYTLIFYGRAAGEHKDYELGRGGCIDVAIVCEDAQSETLCPHVKLKKL
jgi:hypothetical protein